MSYIPTGYPRGRPRKGEVRPPSPNAITVQAYRKRRKERDPEWVKQLALQQQEWYWANHERAKEIKRLTYRRKKGWETLEQHSTNTENK